MVYLDLYTAKGDMANAYKVLVELRDKTDRIRKNYWQYKINRLNYISEESKE
jgi:hypothetical protein